MPCYLWISNLLDKINFTGKGFSKQHSAKKEKSGTVLESDIGNEILLGGKSWAFSVFLFLGLFCQVSRRRKGGFVLVVVYHEPVLPLLFFSLLCCVQPFETPWIESRQAFLSFTIFWNLLKLLSIVHWWCHPTISLSVIPFSSCLQSFPAPRSFLVSDLWFFFFLYLNFPMEKTMAPHSSTLAWKIPWTEEPGRL